MVLKKAKFRVVKVYENSPIRQWEDHLVFSEWQDAKDRMDRLSTNGVCSAADLHWLAENNLKPTDEERAKGMTLGELLPWTIEAI